MGLLVDARRDVVRSIGTSISMFRQLATRAAATANLLVAAAARVVRYCIEFGI